MIVIISGPQGCGKTRHAPQLLRHFGGKRIVDEWFPGDGQTLQDGDVVLTSVSHDEVEKTWDKVFSPMNYLGYIIIQDWDGIKDLLSGEGGTPNRDADQAYQNDIPFATAAGEADPIAQQLERRLVRKGVSHGLRK